MSNPSQEIEITLSMRKWEDGAFGPEISEEIKGLKERGELSFKSGDVVGAQKALAAALAVLKKVNSAGSRGYRVRLDTDSGHLVLDSPGKNQAFYERNDQGVFESIAFRGLCLEKGKVTARVYKYDAEEKTMEEQTLPRTFRCVPEAFRERARHCLDNPDWYASAEEAMASA